MIRTNLVLTISPFLMMTKIFRFRNKIEQEIRISPWNKYFYKKNFLRIFIRALKFSSRISSVSLLKIMFSWIKLPEFSDTCKILLNIERNLCILLECLRLSPITVNQRLDQNTHFLPLFVIIKKYIKLKSVKSFFNKKDSEVQNKTKTRIKMTLRFLYEREGWILKKKVKSEKGFLKRYLYETLEKKF